GPVPFGYVPDYFSALGSSPSGTSRLLSCSGVIPFGYVPDYFSALGSSPSGTSRLLSCSGVIPFGYVPTTFLLKGHPLRIRPGYFPAQGSSPW
ncbi:hypothetical protein CRG98_044686, partial [Punica granatum]